MEIRAIELLNEIKSLILGKVNERWLTVKEVSDYTSLSESTIRRAIKKGVLKFSDKTGRLLFKVSSVDRWLNG
jgi:excisionase family DNA binding protein